MKKLKPNPVDNDLMDYITLATVNGLDWLIHNDGPTCQVKLALYSEQEFIAEVADDHPCVAFAKALKVCGIEGSTED